MHREKICDIFTVSEVSRDCFHGNKTFLINSWVSEEISKVFMGCFRCFEGRYKGIEEILGGTDPPPGMLHVRGGGGPSPPHGAACPWGGQTPPPHAAGAQMYPPPGSDVHLLLAHTPVLVRASAREARANGRDNGLGGRPQERLPLNGRRGPTRPSILWLGRAALHAVKQCRLWVLGWRDADASLCSGLLAAMPRCLCLRLERNSAGRCHCCGPGCRRLGYK